MADSPNLHRVVFYMTLFFGCLTVFLTPPVQAPDEASHFTRAVMVAEGRILSRERNGVYGQEIPASLAQYIDSHLYLGGRSDQRYSYQRWYADSHASHPRKPRVHRSYSTQATSPLYYLPQAAGIWVAKALYIVQPIDFNWSAATYFSRLGNLLFYAIGIALAIKTAPRFGAIIAFIALTPMSLTLAASASYDVLVIVSAVGFFVTTLAASSSGRGPSRRQVVALGLLAFVLGHSKVVYAPVLLTLLVLLKPMGWRKWLALAAICNGAAILGALLSVGLFGLPQDTKLQAAVAGQISHLGSNWLSIPSLIVNSLAERWAFYFISYFGNLGWLDTNFAFPALILVLAIGLLAVASDAGAEHGPDRLLPIGAMLVGSAIAVALIFVSMYVIWTSMTSGIGAATVDGVQGRYFIPLTPYVLGSIVIGLAAVAGKRLAIVRATLLEMQLVLTAAVLVLMQVVLLLRYWIPAPT